MWKQLDKQLKYTTFQNNEFPLIYNNTGMWVVQQGYMYQMTIGRCLMSISMWNYFQTKSRADSRFVPSQWVMVLLCKDISHWLGTNLDSALSSSSGLKVILTNGLLDNMTFLLIFLPIQWHHVSIIVSQITSNLTVCSAAYSSWSQIKHQRSTLLALS